MAMTQAEIDAVIQYNTELKAIEVELSDLASKIAKYNSDIDAAQALKATANDRRQVLRAARENLLTNIKQKVRDAADPIT
jgi:predicted  nucleic acid-binding Zn-ribbon protein